MDDSAADAMPAHRAAPDQGRVDGGELVTGGGIPEDRGRPKDPGGDDGPQPTASASAPAAPQAEAVRVPPSAATASELVGAASFPSGDSAPADSRPRTPADAWPAAHEVVGIPGPRVGAPTPTYPYAPGNPPGAVPGAYTWVPGPRVSGPVPYRRPNDTFGLWPHAVIDPRRERQTPAIVVSSLVACVLVELLLVAFVRP
ncbi:MAG: hypothetical protein HOU01_19775, partial [Streptomycetaceae bacterium]|nr:hypothetical protein [Streptomycetaceae bacterium]